MATPTIMLADNDKDFLEIAQEFLARAGYHVISVTDPCQAKEFLTEKPIAVAFLDYRLVDDTDRQDRSGLKVAIETIEISSVSKVILTGLKDAGFEYVRESLRPRKGDRAAAVDFLPKHEGLEKMLEVIERNLNKARVFVSYAKPDYSAAIALYENLEAAGLSPWIDKKHISGGMKWEVAIRDAIRQSDFFLVCLSNNSLNRRGYFQKEIRMALSLWEEKLEDDVYLIPVRLEECDVRHEKLQELQWVDLFHRDGFQNLIGAIKIGMSKRN